MTVMSMTGAASGGEIDWHSIDWAQAHRTVQRLQRRIAKATREGRWGKVKALQWLLTHSLHGKMLAVSGSLRTKASVPPEWTEKRGPRRDRKPKLLCRSGGADINRAL